VSALWTYRCAVTTEGRTLLGQQRLGQLGDGTTDDHDAPTADVITNAQAVVSVGDVTPCALTKAGGVRCWGNNDHGQLGDGTTRTALTPPMRMF